MISDLFSFNQFYVQFQVPNVDELTSYVMSKGEEGTTPEWSLGCEIKTTNCHWQESFDLIHPSVHMFSDFLGKPFSFLYLSPWINTYERGSFQEIHSHLQCDFVSVFFPQEQEEGFGEFYFYDRHNNFLTPNWQKVFDLSPVLVPSISAGDIIFFPSTVLHGVRPHRNDKARKTLSCNFILNPAENK